MKRWIHANSTYHENTDFLEIEVRISYNVSEIEGATVLDIHDSEFFDFESSLLDVLDMHGFVLEDAYQSDRPGSVSQYYILIKTNEEGTRLRVYVKLRVSDHEVYDKTYHGRQSSFGERDSEYVKHEARTFAEQKYNQSRGYRPRHIDIVFDDIHFTSYEDALQSIESRLEQFDPE